MRNLIDSVFKPLLNWLNSIYNTISSLEVPLSHPLDIANYLGPFGYLGPAWITFIVTGAFLGFAYMIVFLIVAQHGLFIKFKNTVKWW